MGRIELGDEDGAMPKTAIHAPGIGLGQLDSDYDQFTTESIQDLAAPFYVAASEKATKITCYTPRYLRLQVGVSYTPQIDQSRNVIAWRTDPSNFLEGGINDVTEIGDVNDLPDGLGQDQPARPTTTVGIFRGGQQNQRIMRNDRAAGDSVNSLILLRNTGSNRKIPAVVLALQLQIPFSPEERPSFCTCSVRVLCEFGSERGMKCRSKEDHVALFIPKLSSATVMLEAVR